jgi:hypothetical protein
MRVFMIVTRLLVAFASMLEAQANTWLVREGDGVRVVPPNDAAVAEGKIERNTEDTFALRNHSNRTVEFESADVHTFHRSPSGRGERKASGLATRPTYCGTAQFVLATRPERRGR